MDELESSSEEESRTFDEGGSGGQESGDYVIDRRRPPASGERAALSGYVPQYEVAASIVLRALTEESLVWLSLMDPEAGRLDDFQIATPGRLDAYQIKWSQTGGQVKWSRFISYLVDLVNDRRRLADQHGDRQVIGHLYMDQVASNSPLSNAPENQTGASAVAQLLIPATEQAFASVDGLPTSWTWLWGELSNRCGITENELLSDFQYVRIEQGRQLPSSIDLPGRSTGAYRRDLKDLRETLFDLAIDPRKPVRVSRDELLARLGSRWQQRLELRSVHEFPPPTAYEPVQSAVEQLNDAINRFATGYVALVGSPGSGKSTLLTQELRGRSDVVARYYAYVRGHADIGPGRAEASGFLHDLVLTLERGGLPRGAAPVDFDVLALSSRLETQLFQLGERFQGEGQRSIILVDGLDHVERASAAEPLLRYLPLPESLPEGVLFVLGSQTVRMVDPDIRVQLEQEGRTIHMAGLNRVEVARVADAWNVLVDAGRLWEVSDGHPLILTYLLEQLRGLPGGEQEERLNSTPTYAGDVERLYSRLWASVEEDGELVELLALVSRMRGPVDLDWLRDHGQPSSAVRRLADNLAYLFRRETDRWSFFHESFRLFLEDRTARVGDELSPAQHRRAHRQLAEMCRDTPARDPQSWEVLFHLAAAEEHESVLATSSLEFFRDQLFALRPPELVEADIRMAVRSLAYAQDPMAFIRLAMAAGEVSQRSYNMPDREEFFSLLVLTGHSRTAIDHMEVEREQFGEDDSRTARLRVALLLQDGGHYEDAQRVFEANEPWDVLSGVVDSRQLRGPYELLYAWARVAVVLRGPDAVLAAAERLRLPTGDRAAWRDAEEDPSPVARAWMIASSAEELDARGQRTEADRLLAYLDPERGEDRSAWLWALSHRWGQQSGVDQGSVDLVTNTLSPQDVDAMERVVVAEGLWRAGQRESARQWIDYLSQPPLSDALGVRDLWEDQALRYRLNRLLAAFGRQDDPEVVLPAPDKDHQWGRVFAGRITISVAQLNGRAWAGERLPADEFMTAARSILRTLDLASRGDSSRRYQIGQIRSHALAQLLMVANQHGRGAVRALWDEYSHRWDENPGELRHVGHEVLEAALNVPVIPRAAVMERLSQMEEVVRATLEPGEGPREMTGLARTMLEAARDEDAKRLLQEAVTLSLAVYHRKDYQLSEWIDLLGPRLDDESGAALVRWLAGSIYELQERDVEAPVTDAAKRLLHADNVRRPGHAWSVGTWLEQRGVLEWDARMAILLGARVEHAADQLWWTALNELLAPISPDSPQTLLGPAGHRAVAGHGISWLREQLRILLRVVEVDAPPHARDSWRLLIADCAAEHDLPLSDLEMAEELHPDLRPPRSRSRGTGEEGRDQFLANHQTVEELLGAARGGNISDWDTPWREAVGLVAPKMSLDEVEETSELFPSGTHRLSIQLCLARRALELGAPDVAGRLANLVISEAEPRSWLRNWDRGPLMGAFRLLAELDPAQTLERAYRRFASDATSETFLMTEVSRELEEFLDLFGVDDREALAQEVEDYLRVLLGDPEEMPHLDVPHAEDDALSTVVRAGIDLLALPYRLAVTTAQRGLLAMVCRGDNLVQATVADALEGDDEELTLRFLSVLEAANEQGVQLSDDIADALMLHSSDDHLGLRLAARRLAGRLGRTPDPISAKALPAAYRLMVPDQGETPGQQEGRPLGRDDLETLLPAIQKELLRLATVADVDPGILQARTGALARQLAGINPVDDSEWQTTSSSLGWSFHKPSVALWERAVSRVAAELVDAGRLDSDRALLLSVGPMYDPALIAARPSPRPDVVIAALQGGDDPWINTENWLQGLAGASERLTHALTDEWKVIGERTELRRLDRIMPREIRSQSLGAHKNLDPDDRPDERHHSRLARLSIVPAGVGASPLIYHWDPSYRGASAWLTLHPRLAEACGWERDPDVLIGWRDDDGPIVRSFWWRSGWLDSTRWFDKEEVGEGWLVIARARAFERLAEMIGDELGVAWQVERGFMVTGQPSKAESGVRALA